MRSLSRASLVLGAVVTCAGIGIMALNVISLAKTRRVSRIVD